MTSQISLSRDPAHVRHGSNVGQPLTRRDGVLKVTGAARYGWAHEIPSRLVEPTGLRRQRRLSITFRKVRVAGQ